MGTTGFIICTCLQTYNIEYKLQWRIQGGRYPPLGLGYYFFWYYYISASAYEHSILTVNVTVCTAAAVWNQLQFSPTVVASSGVVNRLPHYGTSTRSRAAVGVNVVGVSAYAWHQQTRSRRQDSNCSGLSKNSVIMCMHVGQLASSRLIHLTLLKI